MTATGLEPTTSQSPVWLNSWVFVCEIRGCGCESRFEQEIRSSNPPVVTGICDPNKARARHHYNLKLGLKLKYLKILIFSFKNIFKMLTVLRLDIWFLFDLYSYQHCFLILYISKQPKLLNHKSAFTASTPPFCKYCNKDQPCGW